MITLWNRLIWQPFQRAFDELPWFAPVFSSVLVATLINILTTALTEIGGWRFTWGIIVVLAVATVGFVYFYHERRRRYIELGIGIPIDIQSPRRHRGLVFLFSRGETLNAAIDYHLPELEQCWVVVTSDMQTKAEEAIGKHSKVRFSLVTIDSLYDTTACYNAVRNIFQQQAALVHIPTNAIIADITGGTKPMSVGMYLACLEGGHTVEHIPTRFDTNGNPLGPLPPIEIRLQRSP